MSNDEAAIDRLVALFATKLKPDVDGLALARDALRAVRDADRAALNAHIDRSAADFRSATEAGIDPTRNW